MHSVGETYPRLFVAQLLVRFELLAQTLDGRGQLAGLLVRHVHSAQHLGRRHDAIWGLHASSGFGRCVRVLPTVVLGITRVVKVELLPW